MTNRKYHIFKFLIPIYLISIFFLLIHTGCSDNKLIKEDKFIKIYCNLVIAQDTTKSNFQQVRKNILKKFSVSEKKYKYTLDYYNNDPKKWNDFFQKSVEYVDKLRKDAKQ